MLCFSMVRKLFLRLHGYGEFLEGETLSSVSSIVNSSTDAETHRRQKVDHWGIIIVCVNLDARYFFNLAHAVHLTDENTR